MAMVSLFVSTYASVLIRRMNRAGDADHYRPLLRFLSLTRSVLVIVYAAWSALAARRTLRNLVGNETTTTPAATCRFVKFRPRVLAAITLYIISSMYILYFGLWGAKDASIRTVTPLRWFRFVTNVADIVVFVALAMLWQPIPQDRSDGSFAVIPTVDDVEMSELETIGHQDYRDDEAEIHGRVYF